MKERTILHVDLNNFYASVAQLYNPELRDKAFVISGNPETRHGVVLAKNEAAKKAGIVTGESLAEAKRKIKNLYALPTDFAKYAYKSAQVKNICSEYTPLTESFGLDECWLDVTDSERLFGSGEKIAEEIRQRVKTETGLTVSIGVSFNKIFSKLGSDMKKPRGLTIIDEKNHIDIIKKLKIDDMIMIGKHTAKKLRMMNVNTLYDLYLMDPKLLRHHFGIVGLYLHNAVSGIDDDKLITPKDEDTKSVGNGAPAVRDMTHIDEIKEFLHNLASKVSRRLRAHKFSAKTIHLTIKFADFTYLSAQNTMDHYFSNEQDIYNYSFEIFSHLAGDKFAPVRALRICTTNLINKSDEFQVNLFTNVKNENLCSTIDYLKEK